jgi:flagellar biosynthesis regulator FlaF
MLNLKYLIKALFCLTVICWIPQCYGKESDPCGLEMRTSDLTKEEKKAIEKFIDIQNKKVTEEMKTSKDTEALKYFNEHWSERIEMGRKMLIEEAMQLKASIVPIVFYGKIIDQYGQPVTDANVSVSIDQKDIRHSLEPNYGGLSFGKKEVILKTDENGVFKAEDKGKSFSIDGIEKSGYEVDRMKIQKTFEYPAYKPDISKPFIIKIRKRGELAFLMKSEGELWLDRDKDDIHKEREFDFQTTYYIDSNYVQQREKHTDIKAEVNYFYEDSVYEVNIITLDPNSGLILSNDLLNEAPEIGYQPEIFFEYEQLQPKQRGMEIQKYLYIKSRTSPQIYSRAVLNITRRDDSFRLRVIAYANPTGSRNLEYDQEWNSKERLRRVDEKKKKAHLKWEQEQKEWKKLEKEREKQSK